MAAEHDIWSKVADLAKRAAHNPALFRAIDAAVPVVWENNTLVIGLRAEDGAHAGVLNTGELKLKIEQAVRQVSGIPTAALRIIEGTSLSDWEAAKTRDAYAQKQREATIQRASAASASTADSWDGLYDVINRLWNEAESRNLATGRGRFLQEAFGVIEESMGKIGATGDEASERAFSRTIERLAGITGSDAAVLAYLLLERQRE